MGAIGWALALFMVYLLLSPTGQGQIGNLTQFVELATQPANAKAASTGDQIGQLPTLPSLSDLNIPSFQQFTGSGSTTGPSA